MCPIYGQVHFDERVNIYDVDSLSVDIIYDDFDNDNDIDLIKYRTFNERNVLLQKNENGDLNLKLPTLVASGVSPIVSLDMNNDGYPDLITYHTFDTIGVLYNLHNDTFSEEQTLLSFAGSYSISPIKFDYNNDGFIDLIVKNNDGDAYVLLNNQNGGFLPAQYLMEVGFGSTNIYKIDDIDNDGDYDLYVRDFYSLKIYINNNGTFVVSDSLQITSSFEDYGILDIDGNGYNDVLYWENDAIRARYFGFDPTTHQVIVINDSVVAPGISYYTFSNNGSAIFIKNTAAGVYDVYIALESQLHHSDVYKFNISNGVFSAPQAVLPDFDINVFTLGNYKFLNLNDNGAIDFVFSSSSNSQNMILVNYDIDNLSDQTQCIQQTINTDGFTVVDMDGDGAEDVCIGQQNGLGYFKTMVNNEYGAIKNLIGVMVNPNASMYTLNYIMDFDNDGVGDVIDYSSSDMYAKVFRNLGDDHFVYVQNVAIPVLTAKMHFADIDNDGFRDLLFQKNPYIAGDELMWAKNNGIDFGSIQPISFNYPHDVDTVSLDFGDVNNNGTSDILMLSDYYSNNAYHYEVILIENQNGVFSAINIASLTGNYGDGVVKIKDFDQDGDLDFFIYDKSTRPFLFYRNDGQNNFHKIVIENINIHDIAFDDNDGDGKYEIYATNYNPNSYSSDIFYYRTTDFTNFTKFGIDSFDTYFQDRADLLLFDYNGDKKKDLFVSKPNFVSGLVSVYINSSNTLSVAETADSNHLKIFPNPFTNAIHWDGENNMDYQLQLFTLDGKLIHERKTPDNKMDFSFLESGMYILVIENLNSHSKNTCKIIKK
ncbi:T9SS type A sorting domain-containing protein [Flavobacterium pallidum]|nr:T9SS type A sorting domain-containing protein [Flavobacterium pallidum]